MTAPGAEIDEGHELVAAIDVAHEQVFGAKPERDVTRWFSDASALTRYGIPTVNYGTSTGLMDVELGENLEIDGLVQTAEVYARVAMEVCGVVTDVYTLPPGLPVPEDDGARRPSRRARAARPDARVVAGRRERARLRRDLHLSALGQAGRAAARRAGTRRPARAAARRSRARSATSTPISACRSPGSRRSRSTTSSSSRSGTGCRSP